MACGHNEQGYHIERPRTWFHAAVSFATFALHVAGVTVGGIAAAHIAGNALGAIAEKATTAGARHLASGLEAHLMGATTRDGGTKSSVDIQVGGRMHAVLSWLPFKAR